MGQRPDRSDFAPSPEQLPPSGARLIPLSRGWACWVDDADYDALNRQSWNCMLTNGIGYAMGSIKRRPILMHKLLMPHGRVDHAKRHDDIRVVDNRRSNLRYYVLGQNSHNARKRASDKRAAPTSVFKGVNKDHAMWLAKIRVGGRNIPLGWFKVEAHAAYVYDLAAVKHFGAFALTNFPVPGSINSIYGGGRPA